MSKFFRKLILTLSILFIAPQLTLAATSLSDLAEFTGIADDNVGHSVSSAGDIDGDGYDDFLISAYYNNDGGAEAGAVYLIYGSATEFSVDVDLSTQAVEFIGENAGDHAGESVDPAGDVDGDGYDDFLIGAPNNDGSFSNAGAAYLLYGSSTRYSGAIDLSTAVKFTGEAVSDVAGTSLSPAGDVNGDDYDDFLIGAPVNADEAADAGAVYLIYGQSSNYSGTTSLSTFAEFTGESSGDYAGISVSSAGDIDNDGYDDFLIGAYFDDDGGVNAGAAYLIYGSSTDYTAVTGLTSTFGKFIGGDNNDRVGISVSSAGDVNGDDFDDFLVGAYFDDDGGSAAGTAYLLYGKTSDYTGAISLSAHPKFTGEAVDDNAGQSVATVGDINADGYDDFLVGADNADTNAGSTYLVYGQSTKYTGETSLSEADGEFNGEVANDYSGYSVASAGDVNGDGFNDIIIGAEGNDDAGSAAGAAYLGYLYVDNDGDGVAGTDGLLSGTDCDDSDGDVYENQTYYVDSDGDGYGSTTTASLCSATAPTGYSTNATDCSDSDDTVYENQTYYVDSDEDDLGSEETGESCSSTAPEGYTDNSNDPDDTVAQNDTYYRYDPMDKDQHDAAVTEVEGMTNGRIKVTYKDGTSYNFTIYNTTDSKKTKAKQYRSKGYYIVSQPRGKKIAIVNIYTGQVQDTITVASSKKYPINGLKIMELQNKYFAVLISRKKSAVRVYAAKILINTPKFGKDVRLKITDSKVTPSKTVEYKNHKIRLKGSKGKVRHTLKMNYTSAKEYTLKQI